MFQNCVSILRKPKTAILSCLLGGLAIAAPGANASDELESTALAIAPQDVAFFSTSVNMTESWNDFVEGDFVARVRSVPFVQNVEGEFWTQWENPQGQLQMAKGMMQNPNVKNLIKLATDMFHDEVFVYGGDDWCELIEGMMDFQNEMTTAMSSGEEAMEQFFANIDKSDIDKIRIPTTVIGFRLAEDENARLQLDALEGILRLAGGQIEQARPILERLKRSDLEDGQTLALTLDTGVIPLEMLDGDERMMAEKVIEMLEGRSISMAIGVKANNLLIAFGEGDSVINSVGESATKLIEHEAFDVLKEHDPSQLRSITYASERWRKSQWDANFGKYFQRIMTQMTTPMKMEMGDEPGFDALLADIEKDAAWLDSKIADYTPEFGPIVAWSNAIDGGTEGYMYDWNENVALENGQPIGVLSHSGNAPLMVAAFKQQDIPVATEMMEYVLDKVPGHIERIMQVAGEPEEEVAEFQEVMEDVWPVVLEAYEILRDEIGPSMSSRETMIVAAGGWTTQQLMPEMPPSDKALPLPEFALAMGLTDRDQFLKGADRMYSLFDRIVEIVRERDPDAVPEDYTVPRPQEENIDGGTRYYYSELSDPVPVPGFEPQLLVGEDVLVLGYSDRQVRDMAGSRELVTRPGWMTDSTPTAGMTFIDFAAGFAAAKPWVEYALMQSGRDMDQPLAPGNGPIPTGNDVLALWDCFQAVGQAASTVSVSDEGPMVTRWAWVAE